MCASTVNFAGLIYEMITKNKQISLRVLKNLAWVLKGMTDYALFSNQDLKFVIKSATILFNTPGSEIKIDCLNIFKTYSDTRNEGILTMIAEASEKLIGCLTSNIDNCAVTGLCLRTICNLSSSENSQIIKVMLNAGVLNAFYALLINSSPITQKEVLWGLSNFAVDCKEVVQQIIQHEVLEKVADMAIAFDLN